MTAGRRRVLVAALLSGLAHVALAPAALFATRSGRRAPPGEQLTIDIDVEPEPQPKNEPEPPAEVAPAAQTASAPAAEKKPVRRAARSPAPIETGDAPAGADAVAVTQRFSVSMQSSSGPGEMAVAPPGHGGAPSAHAGPPGAAPAIEGAAASVLPLPVGRCSGTYTEEARQAGIEGTVILDLVVGEDGRPRDIKVVQGLAHGLTGAAIAALRRCRFTPGERSGARVAVRLRAFKIRFLLLDSD